MAQDLKLTARYILILWPPTLKDAFNVRVGLQTNVETLRAVGDMMVVNCKSIEGGVASAVDIITNLGLKYADDFTLVYPLFAGANEEEEAQIINTAWEVKEVADEQNWVFSRTIPIYEY